MNFGRKLANAVGGWLQFEFECHRSHVFSEKYMAAPIGQLLSSYYGKQVYAEVVHPILQPTSIQRGRRPEIDFVILDPYPQIKLAIETKWCAKKKIPLASLVWDILRLSLLNYTYGSETYLVLGGKRAHLVKQFSGIGFKKKRSPGTRKLVLRTQQAVKNAIRPDATSSYLTKIFRSLFVDCQDIQFPSRIKTVLVGCYPKQLANFEYQIYVWRIDASGPGFRPSNHRYYRT